MRALTWQGIEDVRVDDVPTPASRTPPTPSCVSPPPRSAARTCTCTGCSRRTCSPATSSATSSWASSRRSARVAEPRPSVTGSSSRSTSPAGAAGCAIAACFAQCETTQNTASGKGASLFGYTSLYGAVPGGQAEYVRVPHADFGPIVMPDELPTSASSTSPTSCRPRGRRGVRRRQRQRHPGRPRARAGRAARRPVALHRGVGRVIGVDLVPDRIEKARAPRRRGHRCRATHDVADALIEMTDGRGPDAVIDAVGMEAHGNPVARR